MNLPQRSRPNSQSITASFPAGNDAGGILLIIGRSVRALAASASRAGYQCDVIDQFLDGDTRALAHYRSVVRRLTRPQLEPLLSAWRELSDADALIIPGSGFEADSSLINWLENFAPVAANRPAVIQFVKDPQRLADLLKRLGIPHPAVCTDMHKAVSLTGSHLIKQAGADGGSHIRTWRPGSRLADNDYLQARMPGLATSAVFLGNGRDSRVLGYNRCLRAAEQSGCADDYRFAGAIRIELPAPLTQAIESAIARIVHETGLRGLCGIDMLVDEVTGTFQLLEVNPRPPASFELHEHGSSLVQAHIEACNGQLPAGWPAAVDCAGKLVVYHETTMRIPTDFDWPAWTADRPEGGNQLEPDAPLCTIFAQATTVTECERALIKRRQLLINKIKNNLQYTELNKEYSA